MEINTKFRRALLVAIFALGISLLVIGKNAKAGTTPLLAASSFSSIQLRISAEHLLVINKLRQARDSALVALNQHTIDEKDTKSQEEGLRAHTVATNSICGFTNEKNASHNSKILIKILANAHRKLANEACNCSKTFVKTSQKMSINLI